jgi:hypothetical protein
MENLPDNGLDINVAYSQELQNVNLHERAILLQSLAKTALGLRPETDITEMDESNRLQYLDMLRTARDATLDRERLSASVNMQPITQNNV